MRLMASSHPACSPQVQCHKGRVEGQGWIQQGQPASVRGLPCRLEGKSREQRLLPSSSPVCKGEGAPSLMVSPRGEEDIWSQHMGEALGRKKVLDSERMQLKPSFGGQGLGPRSEHREGVCGDGILDIMWAGI